MFYGWLQNFTSWIFNIFLVTYPIFDPNLFMAVNQGLQNKFRKVYIEICIGISENIAIVLI